LPAPKRGFKDIDPSDVDVKALLSRIAGEHGAVAEANNNGPVVTITVRAANRANAQAAITSIRDKLRLLPGDQGLWRIRLLVHPPRDGKDCFTAILQPQEGTIGRRVIATKTEKPKPSDSNEKVALELEYAKQLTQATNRAGSVLLSNPNAMHMKVRFGTLILDEWKKDQSEYNFVDLCNLVNRVGTRGTAHMVNR
jgi:hypothetical protein